MARAIVELQAVCPVREPAVAGAEQLARPLIDAALERPFRDQVAEDTGDGHLADEDDGKAPEERRSGGKEADGKDRVDADDRQRRRRPARTPT